MAKIKKIAWQSWNAIVQDFYNKDSDSDMLEEIFAAQSHEDIPDFPMKVFEPTPRILYTPYGMFAADSSLKPSDRWDCWLAYTNFNLTFGLLEQLESIEGVEAVKVMGRYTFFIGIGKLFSPTEVKLNIENTLTDTKHISNIDSVSPDLKDAIESIKTQVSSKEYWSIFVSSIGEIDYIMSDALDEKYLYDLNKFEDLRKKIGGVIIRSSNEQKY